MRSITDSMRPFTGIKTPAMIRPDVNARKFRSSADRSSITCDSTRLTVEKATMPKMKVTEYARISLITTSTSHSLYLRIETANASGINASGRMEIVEKIGLTEPTTNHGMM